MLGVRVARHHGAEAEVRLVQDPERRVWPAELACPCFEDPGPRLSLADLLGAWSGHGAVAAVDLDDAPLAADVVFGEPWWRLGWGDGAVDVLLLFEVGDLLLDAGQGVAEPSLQGAEARKIRRQIGHMFEYRLAPPASHGAGLLDGINRPDSGILGISR